MGAVQGVMNYKAQQDTNETNLEIARMNNQANAKLAKQQNEWNRQMWEDTNKYNEPAKQVERLQDAGLSAAAAAQSAAGVAATPMQSADLANQQATQLQAPQLNLGDSLLNIARQFEALKSDKLSNQMKEQDASVHNRLLLTEADKQQWIVDKMQQEYQQAASLFPYRTSSLIADIENRRATSNYYEQAAEKEKADTLRIKQDFEFYKDYNEQRKKELAEQINNIIKAGKKIDAETSNINAQTEESKSRTSLNEKQGSLVDVEKKSQELQNLLTRSGLPSSVAHRTAVMLASGELSEEEFFKILDEIDGYNKSGNFYFRGSPASRNYLQNVYDEGEAVAGGRSPYQIGPWREMMRTGYNMLFGE